MSDPKPCPCGRGFRYPTGDRCKHCKAEDKKRKQGELCRCGRAPITVNNVCYQCHNEYTLEYRAKHPKRAADYTKTARVKSRYGLTRAEYDALLEKPCAICGTTEKRRVCDHDHATGRVRGALCDKCNVALHHVENPGWLEKARAYLADPPY